jgi:hypothetical protein
MNVRWGSRGKVPHIFNLRTSKIVSGRIYALPALILGERLEDKMFVDIWALLSLLVKAIFHTPTKIQIPANQLLGRCTNNCYYYITLQYITLHCIPWFQSQSIYKNTKIQKIPNICTVQLKFSHKKTQWLYMRLFKNTSTYIHKYCQLMLFTVFKWMSHFLGSKYSSAE